MTGERSPSCPFCGSTETEIVAAWGGQLITSQARCRGCNTYFETLRSALEASGGAVATD